MVGQRSALQLLARRSDRPRRRPIRLTAIFRDLARIADAGCADVNNVAGYHLGKRVITIENAQQMKSLVESLVQKFDFLWRVLVFFSSRLIGIVLGP